MTMSPEPPFSINYSVVPAVVVRNDELGRVKVRFPWMTDNGESDWVPVAAPGAGADRGLFYIPIKDDLVLIAFSFGQIDKAYVIGSLWNTADKPPSAGDPNKRTLKSQSGHVITLDDTAGAEQISIVDKAGSRITFDTKTSAVTIDSKGALTIHAAGKLTLTSDDAVEITGETVLIKGTSKLAGQANEITLNGPRGVKVNDGALEVV